MIKRNLKTKSIQNPLNVSNERPGYSQKNLQDATDRENQMVKELLPLSATISLYSLSPAFLMIFLIRLVMIS